MLWLLLPVLLLVYLLYRARRPRVRPWAGVWLWQRGRRKRQGPGRCAEGGHPCLRLPSSPIPLGWREARSGFWRGFQGYLS
ncbi:hypothetical protein CSW45_01070 [Thermus scotoductus]|uniref:Uncharacterized protein n=1 Tax=Thermus scotoductus TaxID=37636 RepID=A0A430RG59_THESC|nr:hypothetical protein CSW45_01070 [Thermus scotoductus]